MGYEAKIMAGESDDASASCLGPECEKLGEGMKQRRSTAQLFQIAGCGVSCSSSETEFTLHSIIPAEEE